MAELRLISSSALAMRYISGIIIISEMITLFFYRSYLILLPIF